MLRAAVPLSHAHAHTCMVPQRSGAVHGPARFVRIVTPRRRTAPCYGSRALSSCGRLAGFKESKLPSCSRAHPTTSAVEADQRHVAMAASAARRTAQCCSGSASRFLRSATNPSGASITASRLRKVAIGCIQVAEGSLKVWGEPAVKAPLELREHFGSLIVWEPAVRAWIASRAARAMSGASPA